MGYYLGGQLSHNANFPKTMKTKRQKKYPNNGPNLQAQRWMERPRFYRAELLAYFKSATHITRPETRAILDLP